MEVKSIQPFLAYYKRIRQRTLRVVNCIPPDKIEWTFPTPPLYGLTSEEVFDKSEK